MSGASTPWEMIVKLINDGEPVRASTPNRPLQTLSNRTQYLYDLIQASMLSEALFLHDVAIESSAVVGDAVYYNATDKEYARAVADVEFDTSAGYWTTAKSAFVVGLVYNKSSSTRGTIATFGTLADFDLSNNIINGSSATPGPYYLSSTTPGKLTQQKPPVSVYVLYNRGDGTAHLNPTPREVLESHIHYRFELLAEPAGDAKCVDREDSGGFNEVLNASNLLPGWLPADDSIFKGMAPNGAKFGYNLNQHLELLRVWPPLPPDGSYIEVNGNGIPINDVADPTVIVDTHGIWWMDDEWGRAPWPPGYECVEESSSSSLSSSSAAPCTRKDPFLEYLAGHGSCSLDEMKIVLWYTRMVFKTDTTLVTSLEPCSAAEPIQVLDCDGQPGTTGRLCLAFDFSKLTEEESAGYNVVKGFDGPKILTGPGVTGVKQGSGILVTGQGAQGTDWALVNGMYRGDMEIALVTEAGPSEDGIELLALNSIRKEYDDSDEFFYLMYPSGRVSSIRGRVQLPRLNLPSSMQMRLWMWFVSLGSGAIPGLTATYRRYAIPAAVAALPNAGDEQNIDGAVWTPGVTFTAGSQYAQAETPLFDAAQGETVDFTIGWDGAGLTNGFGIMRLGYRVEPTA
jgi:hypothetical protein